MNYRPVLSLERAPTVINRQLSIEKIQGGRTIWSPVADGDLPSVHTSRLTVGGKIILTLPLSLRRVHTAFT